MSRGAAIAIVIAVIADVTALGLVPVIGHWETTPRRRGATWVGIVAMAVLGVLIVVYLSVA